MSRLDSRKIAITMVISVCQQMRERTVHSFQMVQGLDHVAITIPAGSEDIARAFYGDTLGLQEIPKPEILAARGGVWYQLPDQRQLHLQSEAKFAPQTRAHPGFTADLDRLSQKVEAQWDDALAPRRRFYVTDPFGNRLEFIDPV